MRFFYNILFSGHICLYSFVTPSIQEEIKQYQIFIDSPDSCGSGWGTSLELIANEAKMSSTKTQCRPPIRSDDLVKVAEPNCLRGTYVAISEHFKNLTVSSYELLSKWCLYTVCQIVYVPFAWSVRQGAAARPRQPRGLAFVTYQRQFWQRWRLQTDHMGT